MTEPSRARVLVVERDDLLRHSTARILEAAGYAVREARDAGAALEAAGDFEPDGALVHVGAEGWSIVRQLRDDPRTRRCPIVAVGSRPIAEQVREPMLAEVEGYLVKPCDPDFLLAVMIGAMGGGGIAERASRELDARLDLPEV